VAFRFGVVVFPGTWSDTDCHHAVEEVIGQDVSYLWHKETSTSGFDCLILPGGFSYGDYLRTGAIARFSPVMAAVERFAADGGPVMGICNGFQVLCEAGLLSGALMRNRHLQFRCQSVNIRVENADTTFTRSCLMGQVLNIPISHGEGSYYVDDETMESLEEHGQVAFRYCSEGGSVVDDVNPNGSVQNIAGILNRAGNVLGMMPHPERAVEKILGSIDGRYIFKSILKSFGHV